MSSFFRSGETSSSEYTETESSDDEQQKTQNNKNSRDVRGLVESSDDEDSARVVKSQKDKVFDACQVLCNGVIKYLKLEDIVKAHDTFKQLVQLTVKANAIFSKTGFPQSIIKTVSQILVLLKGVSIAQLDTNNTKAMKELLMSIDKFKKTYPKQFEAGNKVLAAAQSPQQSKSSLFAGSSDDEDEEEDEEDEDEEDDEEELTSEEEELTEEEEEDEDIDLSKLQGKITRDFWVKKPSQLAKSNQSAAEIQKQEAEEKEKQRLEKIKQREQKATRERQEGAVIGEDGQVLTKTEKRRLEALAARKNETITAEVMGKKLREIVAARGKRTREIPQITAELLFLKEKSADIATTLRIQTLLTLFHFDQHIKPSGSMQVSHWREARSQIAEILSILKTNQKSVRLVEDDSIDDSAFSTIDFDQDVENALNDGTTAADLDAHKAWVTERKSALNQARLDAQAEKESELVKDSSLQYVEGNLYSFLYKLSNEYYIGLQNCDRHSSSEYVNRLREQAKLLQLFEESYNYYLDINKSRLAKRVAELYLQYIYYNYDEAQDVMLHPELINDEENITLVDKWASIVLSSDEPRSRIKALLFQLYAAALHNKYEFAKERIAMSYITDSINELDINTRVLYNRTITQIGLSAFRLGDYKGALSFISDLYSRGQRVIELLAQGTASRPYDPTSTKEDPDLIEAKKRIFPYHQHINTDYLDAAHLISAMIVEVPVIAEQGIASQRRNVSRTFRRLYGGFLERYSSQNITPSIDSARDAILVAAHSIAQGNWSNAYELITKEITALWTPNPAQTPLIKEKLVNAIKIAALKSYLLTNCAVYTSVNLSTLVTMFVLPQKTIEQIINTQAYNEVIHAAWDATSVEQNTKKQDPVLVLASNHQAAQRVGSSFVEKLQTVNVTLERIQALNLKK